MVRRVGLPFRDEIGLKPKKKLETTGGEGYGVTISYGLFGRGTPKVIKPRKSKER